jgi:hypothetical protein
MGKRVAWKASWLTTRRLRTFDVGSLPFLDIEAPETHTFLTREAAPVLLHQELDNLDAPGRLRMLGRVRRDVRRTAQLA